MKVLVLGINGMLGSMIADYMSNYTEFEICGTYRTDVRFDYKFQTYKLSIDACKDFDNLFEIIDAVSPDFIINCIGIIKQNFNNFNNNDFLSKSILVNSMMPNVLGQYCLNKINCKIIQIATDCVYDGKIGNYDENSKHNPDDIYGKTKSLGEVNLPNFLNIRTSIIGSELQSHKSLMDWYIFNKDSCVFGFTNHLWNGVTTLQFAQYCEQIISQSLFDEYRNNNNVIHYCPNEVISKFELLNYIKEAFDSQIEINKKISDNPIDRTLTSNYIQYPKKSLKKQIRELSDYVCNSKLYQNCWKHNE